MQINIISGIIPKYIVFLREYNDTRSTKNTNKYVFVYNLSVCMFALDYLIIFKNTI